MEGAGSRRVEGRVSEGKGKGMGGEVGMEEVGRGQGLSSKRAGRRQ